MDFGEKDLLIIELYKMPWLIWIQLFIMILLILLLFFGFTAFTDPDTAAAAAPPSIELNAVASPTHLNNRITSSNEITKVEEQRVRMNVGTSGESIREEDGRGEESPPSKDAMLLRNSRHPNHPCSYITLAKRAFLKCLGLYYSSESSNSNHHEKHE